MNIKKILFIIMYTIVVIITTIVAYKSFTLNTLRVEQVRGTEDGDYITIRVDNEYVVHYYEY